MLDQLPWLSHAKDAPQRADDLFNVPDLSRLPRQQQSCSRVGPVRNRKAPLRPDPISYSIPVATRNGSTPGTPRRSSPIPLLPLQDRELLDPRTPPPRETLYPEGIRFFNLMPILSLDDTLARY